MAAMAKAVHAIDYLLKAEKYPPRPVCVVFGDEPFLKRLVGARLRREACGSEEADFSLTTFEGRTATLEDVVDELATVANQPDADPLDLLCHIAFNAPLRTRRERAQRLRSEKKDFFDQYGPEARQILDELLDKYVEHGTAQFVIPDVLEVPPLSKHGNVIQIAEYFSGEEKLVAAIRKLQTLLYAA